MDTDISTSTASDQSSASGSIDKSNERVQDLFGQIAPSYDRMNHLLSGGVDYYWRWYTIRRVKPSGEAPILDVCSGTGDLAIAYWKASKKKIPVVGSDFTEEMLEIARKKVAEDRKESDASIEFFQADTQALPFESDTYQIVSVAFGLRNVSDTRKGLSEMIRVCKPGGKVAILEFSLPGNPILRGLYGWYFRNVLPRIGQLLAPNTQSAYKYLPETVGEFPYGKKLAAILEEVGLVNVTHTPLTFGIATLYIGTKPDQPSAAVQGAE